MNKNISNVIIKKFICPIIQLLIIPFSAKDVILCFNCQWLSITANKLYSLFFI